MRWFSMAGGLLCTSLFLGSFNIYSSLNYEAYLESWDNNVSTGGWNSAMTNLPAGPGGTTPTAYNGVILDISFADYNFIAPAYGTQFPSPTSDIASIVSFVHGSGGKVKMSFGGANSAYYISSSSGWPGNINTLAADVAAVINNAAYNDSNGKGLDGVDFDVEDALPAGTTASQFASDLTSFLQAVRALLPTKIITLTIPGQGWNTYWEILAKNVAAIPGLVDCINFMEYDIWIGTTSYAAQITADLQTYTGATNTNPGPNGAPGWGIPASMVQLGLMPGKDDISNFLSVSDATTLSQGANTTGLYTPGQTLYGVMIWDLDRDAETTTTNPVTGAPAYSYSQAIRLGITQILSTSTNAHYRRNQSARSNQLSEIFIRQPAPPHEAP